MAIEISLIHLFRIMWWSMFFFFLFLYIVTFNLFNFYGIFTEYAAVNRLS